jgi:hypothetical protein
MKLEKEEKCKSTWGPIGVIQHVKNILKVNNEENKEKIEIQEFHLTYTDPQIMSTRSVCKRVFFDSELRRYSVELLYP